MTTPPLPPEVPPGEIPPGDVPESEVPRPEIPDVPPEPILSPGVRFGLYLLGWVLVLIGIAGLILPGIQGIVTILAGVVVLSLVSLTVHRWARRGLARWPKTLERYERMREKATHRFGSKEPVGDDDPGGGVSGDDAPG